MQTTYLQRKMHAEQQFGQWRLRQEACVLFLISNSVINQAKSSAENMAFRVASSSCPMHQVMHIAINCCYVCFGSTEIGGSENSGICCTVLVFVTSRVDYCNSVLASASKKVMDKLQHVQNAAALHRDPEI